MFEAHQYAFKFSGQPQAVRKFPHTKTVIPAGLKGIFDPCEDALLIMYDP